MTTPEMYTSNKLATMFKLDRATVLRVFDRTETEPDKIDGKMRYYTLDTFKKAQEEYKKLLTPEDTKDDEDDGASQELKNKRLVKQIESLCEDITRKKFDNEVAAKRYLPADEAFSMYRKIVDMVIEDVCMWLDMVPTDLVGKDTTELRVIVEKQKQKLISNISESLEKDETEWNQRVIKKEETPQYTI